MSDANVKVGMVCFAENTGLGNMSHQFYKYLKPTKTMLLDRSGSRENDFYPERYGSEVMVIQSLPDMGEVNQFITGLDVVLMFEVPPTNYLIYACRQAGVKTVIMPNFEYYPYFIEKNLLHPDALIAPSPWRMDEYLDPVAYVPVPIEPELTDKPELATNFLHIAGRPIFPDRNGTEVFLNALKHVTANITATVTCQVPEYINGLTRALTLPDNVRLDVRTNSPSDWKLNYAAQDVLVMPRRFGGLCMPVNEALGFGMPVIMPAIEPNNAWLPKDWLVPAEKTGERKLNAMIDVFTADEQELAKQIDLWATDKAAYADAVAKAKILAQNYSWEALIPKYMQIFEQVCYH
jgi:glycosyltransferase involved in cell wall biosynthesis